LKPVLLLALLVSSLAAPASAADTLAPVVGPYLKIQQELAADATAGVRAQADLLARAAQRLGKGAEDLVLAARRLQQATTLAAARAAFSDATSALLLYADRTHQPLGPGVRRAYCPMEQKSWAQTDGPIANPYAGKRMLRCGEFTDGKG
jgi:hypothetical protein